MSKTISARGATGVGVASLVSAAAGYVVLLVTARTLSLADNANFLSFWAVLFFVFGTLGGVQNELTRAVAARRAELAPALPAGPDRGPGTPGAVAVGLVVGAATAVLLVLTGPLWGALATGTYLWATVGVIAVAAGLFAGHAAVAGALAGSGRWPQYARLVAAEATLRLLLVLGAAGLGLGIGGYEAAAGAGAAAWVLLLAFPSVREGLAERVDAPMGTVLRRIGHAMVGSASSAALMVGFPALLRATAEPAAYALAAPLLLAVSMTRAPLLMPLNAYQGVAITYFLAHRARGLRAIARVVGAIAGVGVVGALLAWAVGPWLMTVLFGADYYVAGPVLAGLTFSAALLGVLTITGAASLALGQHRAYALAWFTATVACVAVLLLPLPSLTVAVPLALTVGPLVGTLIHAVAIRASLRD